MHNTGPVMGTAVLRDRSFFSRSQMTSKWSSDLRNILPPYRQLVRVRFLPLPIRLFFSLFQCANTDLIERTGGMVKARSANLLAEEIRNSNRNSAFEYISQNLVYPRIILSQFEAYMSV